MAAVGGRASTRPQLGLKDLRLAEQEGSSFEPPLDVDSRAASQAAQGAPLMQIAAVCACSTVACLLVLFYSAWSVLEPWEMGLDYSMISQSISPLTWGTGYHLIGVGHKFLRFNSTVIGVQFSHDLRGSSGGPLRSRTADGLEVYLEISFQYQLLPDQLYKMYTTYGPEFHTVFVKMGMDLLTVAATKHVARAFFVNRTMIGNRMEETLRSHFKENAFVDVPLFQFQAVSLPPEFEAAIKATQVAEQKIKRMTAKRDMLEVQYGTEVMQAQKYVQVRELEAKAIAESIALNNAARIASFNASQVRAAAAFRQVLDLMGGDVHRLLQYMKVRALRDHPAAHSVVGIPDNIEVPHAPKSTTI